MSTSFADRTGPLRLVDRLALAPVLCNRLVTLVVDLHAHYIPPAFLRLLERDGARWGFEVGRAADGRWTVAASGRTPRAPDPRMTDLGERLAWMDAAGIDVQVLSSWAGLIDDVSPPSAAPGYSQRLNEALAAAAATEPDRFRALAVVPLHAPEAAAAVLEHAMLELELAGVEILTRAGDRELDDAGLDPFWRRAEELGCLVVLHPTDSLAGRSLTRYRLDNLVGNPAETTIAVAHLILGGVLERFPGLRICVVHAGGYLPYGAGRLDHGYRAQPELVATRLTRAPSEWLRTLDYDTIGHSPATLRFLADFAGPEHMLMGSDYPFPMGDPAPVETVRSIAGLDDGARAAILGGNAARRLDPLARAR